MSGFADGSPHRAELPSAYRHLQATAADRRPDRRRLASLLREWTGSWLATIDGEGFDAVRDAYLDVLEGRVEPTHAHVLTLP